MSGKRRNKQTYLAYMVRHNLILIGISLFLFCSLFLYYTVSVYNGIYYYGLKYCLADAYVWFLKPRTYGMLILPIIIIIFINLTKYDETSAVLTRLGTVERLIGGRVKTAILLSFTVAILSMVVITVVTSLQVTTVINWDREQSVYYAIMKHTNGGQIQIWDVMLMGFLTIFIRNIFLCLSAVLLVMKFHNNILTFILLTSIVVCEMFQRKIPLFCNFITVDYNIWETPELGLRYFLYCIVGIFFLCIAIKRCGRKMEWINER